MNNEIILVVVIPENGVENDIEYTCVLLGFVTCNIICYSSLQNYLLRVY